MAENPFPHVLMSITDRCVASLMHDVLHEELTCRVTVADRVSDAFAVARASLHPLVVVVDQGQLLREGMVSLFTEHADAFPPLAWVVLLSNDHLPAPVRAFLAAREPAMLPLPFAVEDLLGAVKRAAWRLTPRDTTSATARP